MQTIELNKKVISIEVQDDRIIINLEQEYIPKDGEYFYVKSITGGEYIGIKKKGIEKTSGHVVMDVITHQIYYNRSAIIDDNIIELRPATQEEIRVLDNALAKEGKKWDAETKTFLKIPKSGDFCIFWNDERIKARCAVLLEIRPHHNYPYLTNFGMIFQNCIPFQSAEHFQEFIKK